MIQILGTIIFGAIVGVLARAVIPGRQTYGWIVTILLGIGGALIGYWLWGRGIDWLRLAIGVAAAALLSFIYTSLTRRSGSRA